MIWVLTSEPYHDNSCILGAYTDLRTAVEAFHSSIKISEEDLMLTSCDSTTGEPITKVNWYHDHKAIGYYRYHPHRFVGVPDLMSFDWSKDPE